MLIILNMRSTPVLIALLCCSVFFSALAVLLCSALLLDLKMSKRKIPDDFFLDELDEVLDEFYAIDILADQNIVAALRETDIGIRHEADIATLNEADTTQEPESTPDLQRSTRARKRVNYVQQTEIFNDTTVHAVEKNYIAQE